MDSLKFAFDTLIVGVLALPWLALFARMFFASGPHGVSGNRFPLLASLPEHTQETVATALVIAVGYFLGAAVTRISNNLFDDELWRRLPRESSVRASVYFHEYCEVHEKLEKAKEFNLNLPLELHHAADAERALCSAADIRQHVVDELFHTQESRLLLAGDDKIGRLKEFHDQIIILRGTMLNGSVLAVLSLLGMCACYRARAANLGRVMSYAPALFLLVYGLYSLSLHLNNAAFNVLIAAPHHAPPLAELVLIFLGLSGFVVCYRKEREDFRLFRNVALLAFVISSIAYGAWWWTEVIYDEQVIHSNRRLVNQRWWFAVLLDQMEWEK